MKTSRWIIPTKDVPNHLTVAAYILEKTDLKKIIKAMPRPSILDCLKVPLNLDFIKLQNNLKHLLEKYPAYSYPYGIAPVTPFYRMIYITYNSQSSNAQIANPFPTPKELFPPEAIEGVTYGKNSYDDTLSILERTEIAKSEELRDLLNAFHRTVVRSKIVVHSALTAQNRAQSILSWHTDENIFINTRLNIPIFSSTNFAMEYEAQGVNGPEIGSFDLIPGYAYAIDTGKPHRFFAKQPQDFQRVSLICGFSPWFDYDPDSKAWSSNEYYGELHPFEIIQQGAVADFLNYCLEPNISEPGNADAHSYHSVT